jgi:hypothetical protein
MNQWQFCNYLVLYLSTCRSWPLWFMDAAAQGVRTERNGPWRGAWPVDRPEEGRAHACPGRPYGARPRTTAGYFGLAHELQQRRWDQRYNATRD